MGKTIAAVVLNLSLLTITTASGFQPADSTDLLRRQADIFHLQGQKVAGEQAIGAQPTAQSSVTSAATSQSPESPARTAPPLGLTLALLGICCIMMLFIGVIVLGVILRKPGSRVGDQ